MITSANNTQVKNIIQLNQKAKARREQGLFVAEGRKMFGEAPKDWISRVYVTESLTADESLMKQVMELPEEKREKTGEITVTIRISPRKYRIYFRYPASGTSCRTTVKNRSV